MKHALVPAGLPARFTRSAQADLLLCAEESSDGPVLALAGRRQLLPEL